MLIIRNIIHHDHDHKRFNQFLEIEDINAKVLSARLKEMEKGRLIVRERFTLTLLSELNTPLLKREGGHLSQYLIKCPHFL